MEIQKQNSEKYQIKAKIKEFIEETNEIFESKARQMNSIIQSLKNDHNRIMLKSKFSSILLYQISYEYM